MTKTVHSKVSQPDLRHLICLFVSAPEGLGRPEALDELQLALLGLPVDVPGQEHLFPLLRGEVPLDLLGQPLLLPLHRAGKFEPSSDCAKQIYLSKLLAAVFLESGESPPLPHRRRNARYRQLSLFFRVACPERLSSVHWKCLFQHGAYPKMIGSACDAHNRGVNKCAQNIGTKEGCIDQPLIVSRPISRSEIGPQKFC